MQTSQPRNSGCPVVFNNTAYYEKRQQTRQNQPGTRSQEGTGTHDAHCEKHDEQRCESYDEQHSACHHEEGHSCHDEKYERTTGMVYHAPHGLCNLYSPSQALRHGTLYAELDKPMMHCTAQENQGWHTQQQALAFAAWELRLYLNTHPRDKQALKYFQQLHQQMDVNYATTFIPCAVNGRTWDWIDDPWPWEYAANCDRRG